MSTMPLDLDAPGPLLLRPLRGVGARLFGSAVRVRSALYDLGVRGRERVDCPVVSVGNLTVGGSGKTPLVIAIARWLSESGRRAAVVSRGYGGRLAKRKGAPSLVAKDGEGFIGAEDAGDEPVLIGEKTNAIVVVSPDRAAGARFASETHGAELVLLDDGFQHLQLRRDLDIVVVDAFSPFGNGRLIPAGSLRERPESIARAQVVVVNYGDKDPGEADESPLLASLPSHLLRVSMKVETTTIGPGERPASEIAGRRVALLAAIARPERVRRSVEKLGATVVHAEYHRDHAELSAETIRTFIAAAESNGAELMLTTEKDAVRMRDAPGAERFSSLAVEAKLTEGHFELFERIDALVSSSQRAEP